MRIMIYAIIILGFLVSCDHGERTATQTTENLAVCATTTDIESIVQMIGDAQIASASAEILTCCKSEEDPHYVHVTPSYSKFLSNSHLLIHLGFGCEDGWLPDLLRTVNRPQLQPEQKRNLELAKNVRLLADHLEKNEEGSVHEGGNPHYLLDPIEGIKAAKAICAKFSELRPQYKEVFENKYLAFRQKIAIMLVGKRLAQKYDIEKLALLFEQGQLQTFLKKDAKYLGGHFALIGSYRGRQIVGDHDLWPYFARCYGITMAGYLEPSPGIPPTTQHLQTLIDFMKKENITIILCNPSFDRRQCEFVAKSSNAMLVDMAHQTKSRPGTDNYLEMLEYNFQMLYKALKDSNKQ